MSLIRIFGGFRPALVASSGGLLLMACTTVSVTPGLDLRGGVTPPLAGVVDFDGNREYLPEPLKAIAAGGDGKNIIFQYRTEVAYDETDLSVLAFFNPLSLVGCPIGNVRVDATVNLNVVKGGTVIARYSARSTVKKIRTIYGGESLSRLRVRALRAAADSISAQLLSDSETLASIRGQTGKGDVP